MPPQFKTPLHPEEIKAQLRMRYGTLLKFEQIKGIPPKSVTRVLSGTGWLIAAMAIADELGVPLHRVSSHYYQKLTSPGDTKISSGAHRLNAEAR